VDRTLAALLSRAAVADFLTAGLVARGELTANVLGNLLRLGLCAKKRESGLGPIDPELPQTDQFA
jgi:hypothetical protein